MERKLDIETTIRLSSSSNPKAPVAYAKVFIGGMIHVNGFSIWDNKSGLSVMPPSQKNPKNKQYYKLFWYDSAIQQEMLTEEIIKAYKAVVAETKVAA
jgi:hypothetical protein